MVFECNFLDILNNLLFIGDISYFLNTNLYFFVELYSNFLIS